MMAQLWPEYVLLIGALVTMLGIMVARGHGQVAYLIGLVALLVDGVVAFSGWSSHMPAVYLYHHAVRIDAFSLVVDGLVLLAAIASLLIGWDSERYGEEFPVLVLISALGMMVLGLSNSFIVLFLGIELLSLPLYIMAASRHTEQGGEAGLKYLLLGAFSSGILLFGLALLYGASGTMIFTQLQPAHMVEPLSAVGLGLTLVGLAFKLGAVPFHMWIPDVYEGSPTPVTNFMAFGTKVGAVAILMRFLFFGFAPSSGWWGPMLGYLAVLTMVAGNAFALVQKDLKRLLAYSGIGNAGYIMIGLATHNTMGAQAMLFYLLPYGLAVVGAFAIIQMVAGDRESLQLGDLKGLVSRSPWLAGFLAVVLLSLAGIPLTGGFVGKFYLVQAALSGSQPGLAIGLVVGSLVGLVAYLRPLQLAFSSTEAETSRITWPVAGSVALIVAVIGTIGLGVYPTPIVHIVNHSAQFYWLH